MFSFAVPEPIFVVKAYNEWDDELIGFIAHGWVLADGNIACEMCRMATWYVLDDGILFYRGLDDIFLQCLTQIESFYAMKRLIKVHVVNTKEADICINFFCELDIIAFDS